VPSGQTLLPAMWCERLNWTNQPQVKWEEKIESEVVSASTEFWKRPLSLSGLGLAHGEHVKLDVVQNYSLLILNRSVGCGVGGRDLQTPSSSGSRLQHSASCSDRGIATCCNSQKDQFPITTPSFTKVPRSLLPLVLSSTATISPPSFPPF